MEIKDPLKTQSITARLSGLDIKSAKLSLNQQLVAEVVKRLDNGQHLLKIGSQQISTRLDQKFVPGQKLLIEILKLSDPTTVKIIPSTDNSTKLSNIIRTLLPQQNSSGPLFQTIKTIINASQSINNLPASIVKLLSQIDRATLDKNQIRQAGVLKRTISNSGLFFEAKLLNSSSANIANLLQSDFKAQLLKLRLVLNNLLDDKSSKTTANSTPNTSSKLETKAELTYAAQVKPQNLKAINTKLNLQQYREANFAEINKKTPIDNSKPANAIDSQIKISKMFKALGTQTETKQLNVELTKLNIDKSQLLDLNLPLRGLFPQAQLSHALSLKQFESTDNLLRYLLRQVEGTIARVQIAQINSAPQENDTKHSWLFEIPVKRQAETSLFQFRIEYEDQAQEQDGKQNQNETEKKWAVCIAFDIKNLGTVHVKLQLHKSNVSSHFWLKENETLKLFQDNITELKSRFEDRGFEVDQLLCHSGTPNEENSDTDLSTYLDEKA